MKSVTGWWFGTTDRKLGNDDNRRIVIGETHSVEGEIIPCKHGLHLSRRAIDALQYAPGPIVYKVRGHGTIVSHGNPVDKFACSHRTYLAGGVDCTETLRYSARLSALDVIHLWDAPDVMVRYLKTGDEQLRAAAREAAWSAREARAAREAARAEAREAARAAAREAARAAAWAAAREAAWAAAWAAWEAARAAREAARAAREAARAAWEAAWYKQNRRLTRMLNKAIKEG